MYEWLVSTLRNSICEFNDDVERIIKETPERKGPYVVLALHILEKLTVLVDEDTATADVARVNIVAFLGEQTKRTTLERPGQPHSGRAVRSR